MSVVPQTDPCRFDRWLMPYVDQELDAIHVLEVEEHVVACGDCRAGVEHLRAMRASVKQSCQLVAPQALRRRLEMMVVDVSVSDSSTTESATEHDAAMPLPANPGSAAPSKGTVLRFRYVMPLAAAAALVILVGTSRWVVSPATEVVNVPSTNEGEVKTSSVRAQYAPGTAAKKVAAALSRFDELLDDLVVQHAHPMPPETTDPEGLRRFDPYVGVAVRRPELKSVGARYVGGRIHRRAAMLQYMLDRGKRNRMTMYVFHPKRVPMRTKRLRPRVVNARSVYTGQVRGYSVAASERNGVGYMLASELGDDRNAEIVMAAAR